LFLLVTRELNYLLENTQMDGMLGGMIFMVGEIIKLKKKKRCSRCKEIGELDPPSYAVAEVRYVRLAKYGLDWTEGTYPTPWEAVCMDHFCIYQQKENVEFRSFIK